jgi:hypothetical protein
VNPGVLQGGSDGQSADARVLDAEAMDAAPPLDAGASCEAGVTDAGCPKPCGNITFTGKEVITYQTDSGDMPTPSDLTNRMVAILIYNEAHQCFATYPAVATSTGTFHVDGLPQATYYLRTNTFRSFPEPNVYLVTTSTTIDLSARRLGRPDGAMRTSRTSLSVNATGLDPWRDGDSLWLSSSNAGVSAFAWQDPPIGATTLMMTESTSLSDT